MGGVCCDNASCETTYSAADECGDCCHDENKSPLPISPAPCHDCFCTGALQPSTANVVFEFDAVVSFQPVDLELLPRFVRNVWTTSDQPAGAKLAGQTMLRAYCAFLL